MGIVTVEQAVHAFEQVLLGSGEVFASLQALEKANPDLVARAAASLLVAEAAAVVARKGWSPSEVTAAAEKAGRFRGAATATIAAALEGGDVHHRLRAFDLDPHRFVRFALRMVRFLAELPTLAPAHPPVVADGERSSVHNKVRALLAKAESTPFEAEAEACTAKAQELMARHAIDEVSLTDVGAAPSGITSMRVTISAPYARPKAALLSAVARNNRCQAVWSRDYGFSTLFGAATDLRAVDLLYTSLLVQSGVALQREQERSRGFRHAFLTAFADRIGQRLRAAGAAATAAARSASGDAFLPVFAEREDAAIAARNAAFPRLGSMRVSTSSPTGVTAGRRAADAASLRRDPAVSGGRRPLAR